MNKKKFFLGLAILLIFGFLFYVSLSSLNHVRSKCEACTFGYEINTARIIKELNQDLDDLPIIEEVCKSDCENFELFRNLTLGFGLITLIGFFLFVSGIFSKSKYNQIKEDEKARLEARNEFERKKK